MKLQELEIVENLKETIKMRTTKKVLKKEKNDLFPFIKKFKEIQINLIKFFIYNYKIIISKNPHHKIDKIKKFISKTF
jgi:hypothetical protein